MKGIRQMTSIQETLFTLQDVAYQAFSSKLVPTVDPGTVIGVRTPTLRAYARQLAGTEEEAAFLLDLPHDYYDENQLHVFLISRERDFERCLEKVEAFLPYINNWAACDQLSPKVFQRHRKELLPHIDRWLCSDHTYTVRFGIGLLMRYFLEDLFEPEYPQRVAAIRTEEYYVNMMIAWYFATALARQYDAVLPFIEEKRLGRWTHNKAIQKAVESRRITPEQKIYLKTFFSRGSE